ncbi:MAG: site-specific integrase, partial [Thermoguttaceae bacterium]|nr:site-specific integrase [Thermoguttaceae bacterium]
IAELVSKRPSLTIAPSSRPGDGPTVVEIAASYLEFAVGYYKGGHLSNVKSALKALRDLYGRLPAAEFGPLALKAVQSHLVTEGHSRTYVNQLSGIIKRIFKWAVAEELVPPSVHHALMAVPGLKRGRTEARETAPVKPVPEVVVDKTLPYLPTIVADMVRLQRLVGARPTEICILRPADVDRSGDVWLYTPSHHKTEHHGRARTIMIGPKAQEVLTRYLLRPADSFCFSPAETMAAHYEGRHAARKTPINQGNRPGSNKKRSRKRPPRECYTRSSYGHAIARGVKRYNAEATERLKREQQREPRPDELLPHWSPNQLRHSAATEIRRKFGLEAAQVTLGHAKADVTQVYAERDLALAQQVAREVG